MYDIIRLLLVSRIEDSTTSRVVLARSGKRIGNTGEPSRRSKLNALGFSFWLLKKNAHVHSNIKELVHLIISL
jgi:hypothetical protein